jgi:hypothetical protein
MQGATTKTKLDYFKEKLRYLGRGGPGVARGDFLTRRPGRRAECSAPQGHDPPSAIPGRKRMQATFFMNVEVRPSYTWPDREA